MPAGGYPVLLQHVWPRQQRHEGHTDRVVIVRAGRTSSNYWSHHLVPLFHDAESTSMAHLLVRPPPRQGDGKCQGSPGATLNDQPKPPSRISRKSVKGQATPERRASPGTRHHMVHRCGPFAGPALVLPAHPGRSDLRGGGPGASFRFSLYVVASDSPYERWGRHNRLCGPCHHERVTLAARRNLDDGRAAFRAGDAAGARHIEALDLAASHMRPTRARRPRRAGRRFPRPRQEFPGGGSL